MATTVVNLIVSNLAEDNLLRIAEENTVRDGLHMQAMMRRGSSMPGMRSANGNTTQAVQRAKPLTLEFLTSFEGLSGNYATLVEGLSIVKLNLFDLNGTTVWSTDPRTIGITKRESPLYREAVTGESSSKLGTNHDVGHLDGVIRNIDVVETYLPLRKTREGRIIGVMEVYRDIADDVALQVDDSKATVLRTTIATMGGLFLVLVGFIVTADVTIHRSRRRQSSLAAEAKQTLEDRVRQRTQELEEANEQLLEAQDQLLRTEKLAAIGQLAGSVAHDLRNPLGVIKNAVYYLRRRLSGSEEAQSNPRIGQFLQIIDQEVEHSNQVIADLMTFARVNAPSLSPTDLLEVLESALSGMEIDEDVSVAKRFDADLPEVLADSEQLRRVFVNLTMNAQDAMPEGGALTVSARRMNGFAEVAFSDTGVGISYENVKKVFDPLFTTKSNGTGLGLAICQQIVSRHEGTIDVMSKPSAGATFTVKLPLDSNGS